MYRRFNSLGSLCSPLITLSNLYQTKQGQRGSTSRTKGRNSEDQFSGFSKLAQSASKKLHCRITGSSSMTIHSTTTSSGQVTSQASVLEATGPHVIDSGGPTCHSLKWQSLSLSMCNVELRVVNCRYFCFVHKVSREECAAQPHKKRCQFRY